MLKERRHKHWRSFCPYLSGVKIAFYLLLPSNGSLSRRTSVSKLSSLTNMVRCGQTFWKLFDHKVHFAFTDWGWVGLLVCWQLHVFLCLLLCAPMCAKRVCVCMIDHSCAGVESDTSRLCGPFPRWCLPSVCDTYSPLIIILFQCLFFFFFLNSCHICTAFFQQRVSNNGKNRVQHAIYILKSLHKLLLSLPAACSSQMLLLISSHMCDCAHLSQSDTEN